MNATLLLLILSSCHAAYYLPGVTPHTFQDEETVSVLFPVSHNVLLIKFFFVLKVTLKANKVMTTKSPLQYDYYDLPFCKKRRTKSKAENIGERLTGDAVTTSPYEVSLSLFNSCNRPCTDRLLV
jgi:hypothetical protein